MKILVTFMLLGVCVLAAEDIAVTTSVRPHPTLSGQVTTRDVFTRAGQTNLIRITTVRDGVIISRTHRFYHNRAWVADHMVWSLDPPEASGLTTASGFSLTFNFGTNNQILEAYLGDKNGKIFDAFMSTNGLLSPVPTEELEKIRKSLATRGTGK
jgi:hypothetical protein